jgi:hypothetical protein
VPALDKASRRAAEMPDWMTRTSQPQPVAASVVEALARLRNSVKPDDDGEGDFSDADPIADVRTLLAEYDRLTAARDTEGK